MFGDGEETPSYEELSMRMELSGGVPIPKRTYDALFCGDESPETPLRWISEGLADGRFGIRRRHMSLMEDFVGFCLEHGIQVPLRAMEGIESLSIPEGVEFIGYAAFCGYRWLTNVTIPDSVTSIGGWAFSYCSKLKSVTIPDSVTDIGQGAFENCPDLKTVFVKGRADFVRILYPWGSGVEFEEVWG